MLAINPTKLRYFQTPSAFLHSVQGHKRHWVFQDKVISHCAELFMRLSYYMESTAGIEPTPVCISEQKASSLNTTPQSLLNKIILIEICNQVLKIPNLHKVSKKVL